VKSRLLHLLLTGAFLLAPVAAQNPVPPPNGDYDYHLPGLNDSDWMNTNISRHPNTGSNRTRPSAEPRVLTKGVLAPAEADRLAYAGFLSQRNTGLIRLMPRQFSTSKFYRPNSLKINGGGAYYSFAHLSHEYGFGSDLELSSTMKYYNQNEMPPDHRFHVGFAGADYGLMTNIGDVAIESVSRDDPSGEFMLNYRPPRDEQRARCEYRMLGAGLQYGGRLYGNRLPIQVNSTYLLRSINYNTSDVLVAFRVVRQDPDGSVTLVWKLLKNFNRPTLDPRPDPNFKCPIR
jgi:hypothetical protein